MASSEPLSPGDQARPGTPDAAEDLCPACGGSGKVEGRPCGNCSGTGRVTVMVDGE